MEFQTRHFMGLEFDVAGRAAWQELLLGDHKDRFAYIVTPNVDHVVQIVKRPDLCEAYLSADYHMCDSRVLGRLARFEGIDLQVYPGADLILDAFRNVHSQPHKIAVIGPDVDDFALLRANFPRHKVHYIPAPYMQPGTPEWEETLAAAEASQADVLMLCLSFPKQEIFAYELKKRGIARGIAICAGASVDFITGRQSRAPAVFRKLGMEWAYRLLTNPRRLWRRYLVEGPKIFRLFLQNRRAN